jgi:class 3 adenylate cyclase
MTTICAMAEDSQSPAESSERPETILLVDDDPTNLQVLRGALDGRGFKLLVARSGEDALKVARSARPELILLDIMMPPGINGYETCRRLKQDPETQESAVIFLSSLEETESKVKGLGLGAVDYITKPFQIEEVTARVDTHLTIHRLKESLARKNRELEKANQFIRKAFGRYLSEDVVQQLLDSPEGLELGGEEREVTILISDLRAFTALAARLEPKQVIAFLNAYLENMVEVITRYQGTILEIMGDAIIVVFGAPMRFADHAERGVACALAMQLTMPEVNEKLAAEGVPALEMGIGVHTGKVVVGNIGSQQRTKYDAIGHHVNVAGRIESHTTGGQVMISESTRKAVPSPLEIRREVQIEPKGFSETLTLHDVIGIGGAYNFVLPQEEQRLVALGEPAPVRFSILEEKTVGRSEFEGRMTRLAEREAEIESATAVTPLSNLKLWFLDAEGRRLEGDLYAKVVDTPDAAHGGFRIRFTGVDRDLAERLGQLGAARGGAQSSR